MRVALDHTLTPERVLLALRDEPWPFALTGRWAGGGAIVGCAPRRCSRRARTRSRGWRICRSRRGDAEVGGGWFGWLGYGLGALVERSRRARRGPSRSRDAHLAFYDHVLRQDADGQWWFESLGTGDDRAACNAAAARAARRAAARAAPRPAPTRSVPRAPGRRGHVAAVRDCVERIAAGEIFQANLCLRLEAEWDGTSRTVRRRRAARSSPAYGACFVTPWGGIASLSPELFLRRRGRDVTTGPIKGTAPREADRRSARLRQGPRRARDDRRPDAQRPRAASPSTGACARRVAPVAATARRRLAPRLRRHRDARPRHGDAALLRATFPPGSVTGAPKVQALHVISELESTGREVYTGAIGYASPHAGLELNVAIRTFEARAGRLWLGAGGGIVADSDPHAELEECLVKARPLISAIGGAIANDKGARPL